MVRTRYALLTGLSCAALAAAAPTLGNVFGDGDPENGVEDGRLNGTLAERGPDPWRLGAGTIHCDERTRGSAVMLDVSEYSGRVGGAFLATAAHVLVDLQSGMPFETCWFRFMGFGAVPAYRARIEPRWTVSGDFDAHADERAPEFGESDWAFIHLPRGLTGIGNAELPKPRSFREFVGDGSGDPEFHLVAYDHSTAAVGISSGCRVVVSGPGDLGGGGFAGQLLDDCDSGAGASGGAVIASDGAAHYLVGIRNGAHWSAQTWPADEFPEGPAPGEPWDLSGNTNFARALDAELMERLHGLVIAAERSQAGAQAEAPVP